MKIYNTKKRLDVISNTFCPFFENNQILLENISYPLPNFYIYTANYGNFEKLIYGEEKKHQYHLSGYGLTNNEALMSFLGEASERYSYVTSYLQMKTYIDKYIYVSENKIDVDILKQYNPNFKEEEYIELVEAKTITGGTIVCPVELIVFDTYKENKKFQSVSTGTSAHETEFKALSNAIIEYLQLDSFNLWWYLGFKGKEVEIESILNKMGFSNDFFEYFEIKVTDVSFDKPINVYVCEIFGVENKNVPLYTVGIQGGLKKESAIYRSIMEALTILEYNFSIKWFNESDYKKVNDDTVFDDLDKNVIYYSKFGKKKMKTQDFNNWCEYKILNDIELVDYIKEKYPNTAIFDISAPELEHLNQKVVRIYIPELIPMMVSNNIYSNHERFLKYGGVVNYEPNPLP